MWKGAAALAVVGLVAAGCGSSSKSSSTTSTAGSSSSSATSGSSATSAAASGGPVQGITATTITLGQLADVGGPDPGLFTGSEDGMAAWAAMVNSQGGIDGRKVIVDFKDSALSCSTYTQGIEGLSSKVFALVGTYSLVDICGESTLKAHPTLPDIEGVALDPTIGTLPNVFAAVPATNGYATTGYEWVKAKYGAAAVQHAADLYVVSSAGDFATQEPAAEAAGWKYVYTRAFGNTETDYTSDILRMKSDNVKVVDLIDMSVQDLAGFIQQATQQDFHPEAIVNTSGYDPSFFKLLGSDVDDANSVVFPLPYAQYLGGDAAAVPEINTMKTWLQKTHPSDPLNLYFMESFAAGLLFQQAVSTLGPNPTQAGLLKAVAGITNFTADGLLAPSNVGQKKGTYCDQIVRPDNGVFTRVDPSSGYECNGTFVYAPASS